jgi:hypothetical protein
MGKLLKQIEATPVNLVDTDHQLIWRFNQCKERTERTWCALCVTQQFPRQSSHRYLNENGCELTRTAICGGETGKVSDGLRRSNQ